MADLTPPPPPPPPPPPAHRSEFRVFYVLGSVISILLLVLIVMLLPRSSSDPIADSESTTTAVPEETSVAPTGSAPVSTTLPATAAPMFTLQSGDILISAAGGVRIVRGTEVVGRAVTGPTEHALATLDGRVVYQTPAEFIYPDYWPGNEPIGEPKVRMIAPDGTTSLLYVGGAAIRMFDVTLIPSVSAVPSVIAVRFDALADGSRLNSLLVIPVDGSETRIVSDLPLSVTGAAWLGEFFALAVNEELGSSYIAAFGLDGEELDWPFNPEPAAGRDPLTRVTTLTRIGDTPLIAYTLASGGFWDGSIDLLVYDTSTGETVTTMAIGFPEMIVSALHASGDALVVSKIYDLKDGTGWSLIHVPLTVFSTATWEMISPSIPGAGTYSVVDGTPAQVAPAITTTQPVNLVLPNAVLIYNQPVDDAATLLASAGLTVEIGGIGCSNSIQPGMVRRVTVGSEQNAGIIYGKPSDTFDESALENLTPGSMVTVWTPTSNPCP